MCAKKAKIFERQNNGRQNDEKLFCRKSLACGTAWRDGRQGRHFVFDLF
jgi:hypothetical protein